MISPIHQLDLVPTDNIIVMKSLMKSHIYLIK